MTPFPPGRAIALVLTHRCNLRCTYCYETRRDGRRMPSAVVEAALARIGAAARAPEVLLTGGEPLLEPELVGRVLAWRRGASFGDAGAPKVTLLTNGTVEPGGLLEDLDAPGIGLQVSVDGDDDVRRLHDRDPRGDAIRFLASLRERRPGMFRERVGVSMTVTPRSAASLTASVRFLLGLGVRSLSIAPAMMHAEGWTEANSRALREAMGELARLAGEDRIRTGTSRITLFAAGGPSGGDRPDGVCDAPRGACPTVDVDGRVYPCPLFVPSYQRPGCGPLRMIDPLPVVKIDDPRLEDRFAGQLAALARSPLFRARTTRRSSFARCRDCDFSAACVPCPAAGGFLAGNADPDLVPDLVCAFNGAVMAAGREASARRLDHGAPEGLRRIVEAARRLRAAE